MPAPHPAGARARGAPPPDGGAGTWMLFRSGSATRIDVGLHEPGEDGRSAKAAYVVKECDPAMQDAAERGRLAALEWWARRGRMAAPAYRVSFDLPGVRSGENVGGASGGLAFAVAAARAVCAALEGMETTAGAGASADAGAGWGAGWGGGAVAAAGELGSGLSGGPVRGVQGIEAKIEGALAALPAGSLLLYPKANDPDVSAGLRERLREGGIEAMSVESVDGALDRIFPSRDAAAAPARLGGEAGSPARHGFLSPRSVAAAPRRIAVAGLIVVAGAAAAALLIAGLGQGDGRWPFGPSPKGDGTASAEPARPASSDVGFEGWTGAGAPPSASVDAPSPEGRLFRPHDPARKPAGTPREPSDKGFD